MKRVMNYFMNMNTFMKDMMRDLSYIILEVMVVIIKVLLVYVIISNATDLHHDQALETAILVGAVDFLSGSRMQLRTVSDLKEKITTSERGKRVTKTIHYHKSEK